MENQYNHKDPDLERIKDIIVERVKKDGINLNEWWLTLIIALFGQKKFNENEMRDIVEELKKRIEDGDQVKRTERGWAGHFCCADRCLFRRNTLLEYGGLKVVVSTVGRMLNLKGDDFEPVGFKRHFETMAFVALENDKFNDMDVTKEVAFSSPWALPEPDMELEANDMHENVVKEITGYLLAGTLKYGEEYL